MVTKLVIQRRKKNLFEPQLLNPGTLAQKLELVSELSGAPRERLIRRIQAGCQTSVPLRPQADPRGIVAWLTKAGADVTVLVK
jgi:hypothetical protein